MVCYGYIHHFSRQPQNTPWTLNDLLAPLNLDLFGAKSTISSSPSRPISRPICCLQWSWFRITGSAMGSEVQVAAAELNYQIYLGARGGQAAVFEFRTRLEIHLLQTNWSMWCSGCMASSSGCDVSCRMFAMNFAMPGSCRGRQSKSLELTCPPWPLILDWPSPSEFFLPMLLILDYICL